MKKIISLLLPLLLISTLSFAGSYSDDATIISVEKVYKDHVISEPYQDCYIKKFYQNTNAPSPLGGAILGGLIGRQLDDDHKKRGTIIGALLGAKLAEREARSNGRVIRREVCETKYRVESRSRLAHYLVKYEYEDRIFTYTTRHKPSKDSIKVNVSVSPE